MPKAIVAGLGIQGVAIAYAMRKLGFDVMGIESFGRAKQFSDELLKELGCEIESIEGDAIDLFRVRVRPYAPDIVISALPFNHNLDLAEKCIGYGFRYCDLGGNIFASDAIDTLAELKGSAPVMTDLGLAPGIVNVIAEIGCEELGDVDSVKIRVGGLPVNPEGRLKYGLLFSIQGLYNEYIEKCRAIKDGKESAMDPLTDIESIHFDGVGDLEAFNTSGGLSTTLYSMLDRGVSECNYKTMRFPGHAEIVRSMLFEEKMNLDEFTRAITNECKFIREDQALMIVEIRARDGRVWEKRMRVVHDENLTAMQKTTGFGAAAVAAIMGRGKMDEVKSAGFSDVPHMEFVENMSLLLPEMVI